MMGLLICTRLFRQQAGRDVRIVYGFVCQQNTLIYLRFGSLPNPK